MTISTTLRSQSYTGTGLVDSYSIPFKFYANDTISVTVADVLLVEGIGYTLGGHGPSLTGTVELAAPLGSNVVLVVTRTVPYLQLTDLLSQGSFQAETIEDALDIIVMEIQQLLENLASVQSQIVAAGNLIYDLAMGSLEKPGDAALMGRWVITRTVAFPLDMAGSRANARVAATAETIFTVKKNGASVATITFAVSGTTGVFSGAAWSVVPGNVVEIFNQATADATLADAAVTMIGTRST